MSGSRNPDWDVATPFDGTTFDATTLVRPDDEDPTRVSATLDASWSSLRGIHGGYIAAIFARAAQSVVGERSLRTMSTSFLRVGEPGPAVVGIETIRAGRSVSIVGLTMQQGGRDIAVARATAMHPTVGVSWDDAPRLTFRPREECVPLQSSQLVRHFDHCEAQFDPANIPFEFVDAALVRGYFRPREPRPIDATWLAMALDWFPPAAFTKVAPPTGGISVDYTVHIHRTRAALKPDEWLRAQFQQDCSNDGLALETGTIADADGTVIAQSFHTRYTG